MESKDAIYRQQIKKKVEDLAKLCYQNNMPCFFVVAVGDVSEEQGKKAAKNPNRNKKQTKYMFSDAGVTSHSPADDGHLMVKKLDTRVVSYLPESMYADTEDSAFSDLINVVNGFTTVPPNDKSNFALDMDELQLPPGVDDEDYDL